MSHVCRLFWSAFASGAIPKCLECSPPGPEVKIRKIGITRENRVINKADITVEIEASNDRGQLIDLLERLGPQFEECAKPTHVVPAAIHQKCLLVGARYPPAVSEPPPPELVMSKDSPFWHERSLEDSSRLEYNIRVAEKKPAAESGSQPPGAKAPSARRTRKSPRRS